jgi:hypothetical protein
MNDQDRDPSVDYALDAIDQIISDLQDARAYFTAGKDNTGWGTLLAFEDYANDLNAAIRLHRANNRRQK